MPLDTSMAGVAPWLNQQPDRPTNTGPAVQGFLGAFERAQERNSPLFRLKLEELGLQMQRDKLLHEMDLYKKNEMVAGMAAAAEMAGERAKVTDPTDPKWVADQWAIAQKHPNPVAIKMAQDAEETRKAALAAKDRSDKILADMQLKAANLELGALKVQSASEIALTKAEAQQNKQIPAQAEAEYLSGLQAQERTLLAQLNKPEDEFPGQHRVLKELLTTVQDKIASVESRHPVMEETIRMTPTGETVVERKRAQTGKQAMPGALTPTEQTRLGEDMMASANALRVLNDLQSQLDRGAVGIIPTISATVFDRVLGQFDKGLVDKHRQTARNNIGIATQQVLGELNNRGRFSNMELQAIKSLMPSLGAFEAPERAKIAVRSLSKVLAEKGAKAAVMMKREIPTEIIHTLSEYSDTDLAQEYQNGSLDAATFWAIFNFKHPGAR